MVCNRNKLRKKIRLKTSYYNKGFCLKKQILCKIRIVYLHVSLRNNFEWLQSRFCESGGKQFSSPHSAIFVPSCSQTRGIQLHTDINLWKLQHFPAPPFLSTSFTDTHTII